MALLQTKLQDLLSFFPEEIHQKIDNIYQRIPGSLLNYLKPIAINKKIEYQESQLPVDTSIPRENPHERRSTERNFPSSPPTDSHYQDPFGSTSNNPSYSDYSTHDDYDNKYENALRFYLLRSMTKNFESKNITEVYPKAITDGIVQKCFQQCPDWGRKTCKTPSVIVRSDSNYINEQKSSVLNVTVYTYAYLACEREEARFYQHSNKSQIKFEVTIELTGLAMSRDKIKQFCQMLADESVSNIIKKIEATYKVTMDNFDQPTSPTPSAASKKPLTWDDV